MTRRARRRRVIGQRHQVDEEVCVALRQLRDLVHQLRTGAVARLGDPLLANLGDRVVCLVEDRGEGHQQLIGAAAVDGQLRVGAFAGQAWHGAG